MKNLVVQKFGGSCLATPEKIKKIAKRISDQRQSGKTLIVVVSAMGKATDELIRLAHEVSPHPPRRELDMLLTTGERVSMTLMSMALNDLGCPAISFTGSQAGVLTDNSHSSARIIDIKPVRVEQELRRGKVVVLAGFQGVHPDSKEITTLGRGGSDTTAVAMAAYFKAQRCEILKDVDGICSADPNIIANAFCYPQLNFQAVQEMCFWGAKVLHYRCVELAQNLNVPLFVGRADQFDKGTFVQREVKMFEQSQVLAVNLVKQILHIKVSSTSLHEGLKKFGNLLLQGEQPWPQILASAFDSGSTRIMLTGPNENLATLTQIVKKDDHGIELMPGPHAAVTLTCHGAVESSLINDMRDSLGQNGIQVDKILCSSTSVTFIMPQNMGERAADLLYKATLSDHMKE